MNNRVLDLTGRQGRQLTVLPPLPDNLEELYCSNNLLTELTSYGAKLPPNLKILDCTGNQLTKLPELPANLKQLYCSRNQLTELPILPPNLKILECVKNKLSYVLPPLPNDLEELYCSNNPLIHLQERVRMKNSSRNFSLPLPEKLKILECNDNYLYELPTLPINLEQLNCSNNNRFEKLPPLPPNLNRLNCSNNNLTELPPLPPSLKILNCNNCDRLTELPLLPPNLKELSAINSPIKTFKFQPFMRPVNIIPSFNTFSIDITKMDLITSELYKRILQDRLNLNPNIKDSYLNQGPVALTWQEEIRKLDKHIDKLNLNSLSRPVFNEDGSMVDATGKRIGSAGVSFVPRGQGPDKQTRLDPQSVKNIGSYFGGKISRRTKIKRSKNARKTRIIRRR